MPNPDLDDDLDDMPPAPRARRMADGLHDAVGQASDAALTAGAGISELRQIIRGQPITMALLMLGLGYVTGRILNARPRD
jgi:hypothetical protein